MMFFQFLSKLNKNHYFLLGIVLGIALSMCVPQEVREIEINCPDSDIEHDSEVDHYETQFEPQLNFAQKPLTAKKVVKNIIRPRYYSSELGIREKLFIGVMTSQENIDGLATAFNKTAAHLVNKIKFFINADDVKTNFRLKNIVGFTDTRENLKPFHILKYIADNYLDDYDYFLIVSDKTYLDARKLKEKLYHISISFDVYMGHPVSRGNEESSGETARDFCDINAGIVLSSSVIRKIRANLDWCVRNAATNHHSQNIGKCVKYSSGIDYCQTSLQGIGINTFKIENEQIYRDLHYLQEKSHFNNAITFYPITTADDFYILHIYFSRRHLEEIKTQQRKIETQALSISNGTISNDVLEIRWPLGVPHSESPETRHDIIPWTYLNVTHSLLWDEDHNVKLLSHVEREDIQKILNQTLVEAYTIYKTIEFVNLQSAYRKFDPVRGMDYRLFINFRDKSSGKAILKSFEVVKPLGLVEIVPSPYVTESTRIAILLPTFEAQIEETLEFIRKYEKICMENQDNTSLMLIFMYPFEASSKGDDDLFLKLKTIALDLTEKYKNDGLRIAWVSIRLPEEMRKPDADSNVVLNTIYGQFGLLSIVATDLALRKIGLDSLVMVAANSMQFRADFLNRIRMNTIQGFQIFSPIGFMNFPCEWTTLCKSCDTCDVGQGYGYFDRANYDVISFYSRDYVEARKLTESVMPIVHSDLDILNLMSAPAVEAMNTIVDMFVLARSDIHILRAVEPSLRYGSALSNYLAKHDAIPECELQNTKHADKCIKVGSKKQIGNAVLQFEEEILKSR